ncbi:MAG: hypothetical protein JSR46_09260, partial [Verrucomicrobia bacterium]|nr:hypothetical protein [Verrucomicrobiota bacterium]
MGNGSTKPSGFQLQTPHEIQGEINRYLQDQRTRDAGVGSMWTPKSRLIVVKHGDVSQIKCTNSLIDRFFASFNLKGYSFNIADFEVEDSTIQEQIEKITTLKSRSVRILEIPDGKVVIKDRLYKISHIDDGTMIYPADNPTTGLFIGSDGTESFDGDQNCRYALKQGLKYAQQVKKTRAVFQSTPERYKLLKNEAEGMLDHFYGHIIRRLDDETEKKIYTELKSSLRQYAPTDEELQKVINDYIEENTKFSVELLGAFSDYRLVTANAPQAFLQYLQERTTTTEQFPSLLDAFLKMFPDAVLTESLHKEMVEQLQTPVKVTTLTPSTPVGEVTFTGLVEKSNQLHEHASSVVRELKANKIDTIGSTVAIQNQIVTNAQKT